MWVRGQRPWTHIFLSIERSRTLSFTTKTTQLIGCMDMEDIKKKMVLLIITAGCLSLAAAMFFSTKSQDSKIPSFEGETVILKCTNCQATHEMEKQEYYKYMQKNRIPSSLSTPPMVCDKCEKESAFIAIRCEKCDIVFSPFAARGDFADICPKCGSRAAK
jgi:hypothetical protein